MIDTQESITAKLCSFARAYHSNVERRKIFDDYLAYDMMGKEEYEEVGQLIQNGFDVGKIDKNYTFRSEKILSTLNRYISPIPISRIAFAEKKLLEFAGDKDKCQYVICGAGMDTFAFRNSNPNIKIFELDHPDTGRYKKERIKELEWIVPQNVSFVPIDFAVDDMTEVLINAGFDPKVPSFFAILGVTYYLTLDVFEQTIEKIGKISAEGSKIIFDYPDETTLSGESAERVKILSDITEKLGETMLHGYSYDEVSKTLGKHGFMVEDHETPQMIQKTYFENRNDNIKAFENIHFIVSIKGGNQ